MNQQAFNCSKVREDVRHGKKREKRTCPMDGCDKEVINLTRHMRQVHKSTEKVIIRLMNKFNTEKESTAKKVRKHKQCENCGRYVRYLSTHKKKMICTFMARQAQARKSKSLSSVTPSATDVQEAGPSRLPPSGNYSDNEVDSNEEWSDDDAVAADDEVLEEDDDEVVRDDEELEEHLGRFEDWIMSQTGNMSSQSTASQYVSTIRKALMSLPGKGLGRLKSYKSLCAVGGYIEMRAKGNPSAANMAIMAFRQFVDSVFCMSKDRRFRAFLQQKNTDLTWWKNSLRQSSTAQWHKT